MRGSYTGCTRNSRGKPMKDRFLSTLSNERKFPEVGANSIVSSWRGMACGFHANVKTSERLASARTRGVVARTRVRGPPRHVHTDVTRNADVREAAWHIFHPFASANLTRSRFPGVGGRRENDFIIHEMQSALGSLEKYRAISRKSKSRYRVLVLNVAGLRFTRGYGAPAGFSGEFTVFAASLRAEKRSTRSPFRSRKRVRINRLKRSVVETISRLDWFSTRCVYPTYTWILIGLKLYFKW